MKLCRSIEAALLATSQSLNPRLWAPLLALVLLALLLCGLLVSNWARSSARQQLENRAADRGWGLYIEDERIRLNGSIRFGTFCLSFLDDDQHDLCFEDIRIRISPLRAAQRTIDIESIHAERVRVHTSSQRLATLRHTREDGSSTEDTSRASAARSFGMLRLKHVEISLEDGQRSLELALEDTELDTTKPVWTFETEGQVMELRGHDRHWQKSFESLQGAAFSLELDIDIRARQFENGTLEFNEALRLALPLETAMTAHVQQVEFIAPYTVKVLDPAVQIESENIRFEAASISGDIGHWTTHLPDLYLASVTVEEPTLYAPAVHARALMHELRTLGRSARPQTSGPDGASSAVKDATEDAGETTAADPSDAGASGAEPKARDSETENEAETPTNSPLSLAQRLRDELTERRWWEVAPRRLELLRGSVVIVPNEGADVVLEDLHFEYALRVIQLQMDMELRAQMRSEGQPTGEIEARLEWEYERKRARLFWDIETLALAPFLELLTIEGLVLHSGATSTSGRINFAPRRGLTGNYEIALDALHATHPRLQAPLAIERASAAGTVRIENNDDRLFLTMAEQALTLEEANATLSLTLDDLRFLDRPRTSRVHVEFDVPDQPAMILFEAIPRSLRGPVADARMGGTWGLSLAFDVHHTGSLPDGRPLWEISAPRKYQLRDQSLSLEYLPEEVDVRRLNEAMRFVFRGPDDSMMRTILIPEPSPPSNDKIPSQIDDSLAPSLDKQPTRIERKKDATGRVWVPLREMSYYLIATQLYREDGSFFRNSGINWLQLRRVLSEALTTRTLSRGASTITMQTVKNVFLSHERSIERKLQEIFLSYWMTRTVPKERILEVYLNVIELGPECNGVNEASLFHFQTPVDSLGLRESVWLSSISPNPVRIGGSSPKMSVPFGACVRCDRLINGLLARQWINEREHRDGVGALMEEAAAEMNLPSLNDVGLNIGASYDREQPPLFELLEPEEPTVLALDRLAPEDRLERWIEESRPLRSAR